MWKKSTAHTIAGTFGSKEVKVANIFARDFLGQVLGRPVLLRDVSLQIQLTHFKFALQSFFDGGRLVSRLPKTEVALENEEHSVVSPSGIAAKWHNRILTTKQKTTRNVRVHGQARGCVGGSLGG